MESYKLIKTNGDELEFNIGEFFLLSLAGLGNPNINYTTQKSFFMDGEVVTNFVVEPRQLTFPFLGNNEAVEDRIDFWNLRKRILRFLSPVNGAMVFQITLDDHTVYELSNVYPTNGLTLDGNTFSQDRNDGRIEEGLKLTAYDPIWRQMPINSSGVLVPVVGEDLIFPIEFPISFGVSGANFTEAIDYEGTWRSYPKITIQGPYTTATLTNSATGASFTLINAITSAEQRIIDLTDPIAGFTVVDGLGNNKISELNLTSNLTQFYLMPDTTNTITGVMNGGSGSLTRLTIEWYTKWLGI